MSGRSYSHGEIADPRRNNTVAEAANLHKSRIGQIVSLENRLGYADVRLLGRPQPIRCALPLDVFPAGIESSWSVRMPRRLQFVLVKWSIDNTPIIERIYPYGKGMLQNNSATAADVMLGGYSNMESFAARDSSLYLDWQPFDETEFGDRTKGGALIRGTNSGDIFIAGGRSIFVVSRGAEEVSRIYGETGLWEFGSGASYLRLGDQRRRALPTDLSDSIVLNGQSEMRLRVAANGPPSPTGASVVLPYKYHDVGPNITVTPALGGVFGVPSLSGRGLPIIEREENHNGTTPEARSVAVRTRTVDAGGNEAVSHPVATSLGVSAPLASYDIQTRSVALGLVSAGGVAVGPNVVLALNTLVTALEVFALAVAKASVPGAPPGELSIVATAFAGSLPNLLSNILPTIPSQTVTTSR